MADYKRLKEELVGKFKEDTQETTQDNVIPFSEVLNYDGMSFALEVIDYLYDDGGRASIKGKFFFGSDKDAAMVIDYILQSVPDSSQMSRKMQIALEKEVHNFERATEFDVDSSMSKEEIKSLMIDSITKEVNRLIDLVKKNVEDYKKAKSNPIGQYTKVVKPDGKSYKYLKYVFDNEPVISSEVGKFVRDFNNFLRDSLVAKKLIMLKKDGRNVIVSLTPEGKDVVEKIIQWKKDSGIKN